LFYLSGLSAPDTDYWRNGIEYARMKRRLWTNGETTRWSGERLIEI